MIVEPEARRSLALAPDRRRILDGGIEADDRRIAAAAARLSPRPARIAGVYRAGIAGFIHRAKRMTASSEVIPP